MHRRNHRDERGQTIVYSVVLLTAIFGFAAVVIDGGNYMLTRRNLQGDVDAAVMAAAQELPASTMLATAEAEQYVEDLNASGASIDTIGFQRSNTRVDLQVKRSTPGFFMSFFGMTAPTIRAKASAQVSQIGQLNGMLPFAALEDSFSLEGQPPPQFAIKITSADAQIGNFGAVAPLHTPPLCDDTPHGADGHRDEIAGDFGGGLTSCGPEVGGTIDTKTGNMVNPTADGFDQRFGSTDGTHADLFADVMHWDASSGQYIVDKPDSPRIGFIPIVTSMAGVPEWPSGSSDPMRVVDYVMVYIGKLGVAGEPAYTRGPGNQVEVWVTPIPGLMPHDSVDFETRDEWDEDSLSPHVISLVD